MHWQRDGDGWAYRRFGRREPVRADEPVVHVCFYEARGVRALGRQAAADRGRVGEGGPLGPGDRPVPPLPVGRRRPGAASTPTSASGTCRPAPVGAYPAGASPLRRAPAHRRRLGVDRLATSAATRASPRSRTGSTREVFFGRDYRVLRGGSFGTDPAACRGTFRNWDYPIRRQIFSGFRCARDAGRRERWPTDVPPPGLPRAAGAAGASCCSTRRTRCCAQSWAPRGHARRRHDQRRRLRRRLVRRATARARCATGGPCRSGRDADLADAGAGDRRRRGAGRGPLGHRRACRCETRRRARSPRAAGCSATTAWSRGWPDAVAALAARLPVADLLTLDAPTDAALLWALVRHRLRAGDAAGRGAGRDGGRGRRRRPGSRLNLLLTDGDTVAATTGGHTPVGPRPARARCWSPPSRSTTTRGWRPVPGRAAGGRRPADVRTVALTVD